jgi:hypothetical protein
MVMLILIFSPYILVDISKPQERIEIDGSFGDWSGVIATTENFEAAPFNPNVDIVDYRVDDRQLELSFYLKVQGDMLAGEPASTGRHMDTAYIFIDTDLSSDTGYLIKGIGADYMIKVAGWQTEIHSSGLYEFTSEIQDWNLWESGGGVTAAASGSELEIQVGFGALYMDNDDMVDVLFYMQSWNHYEDFSDTVITNEQGVLVVEQQGVGAGSISGSGNRLLKLDIQAEGTGLIVRSIKFTRIGDGSDGDVNVVRLTDGNIEVDSGTLSNGAVTFQTNLVVSVGVTLSLYGEVDLSPSAQSGNTIGLRIMRSHDVTPDTGTITLKTASPQDDEYDLSYIGNIPADV